MVVPVMTHTMTEAAKAADLRAQAAERDRAAAESFERSDTDGFLSQWASGLTAQKLRAEADLVEAGGLVTAEALFDLAGNVASTHLHYGQYGPAWVLDDEHTDANGGRRFVNESRARSGAKRHAAMLAKGYTVGLVSVRGYVTIAGSGTGLSGAASCYVSTRPVAEELKARNFTVITTDKGPEEDWA